MPNDVQPEAIASSSVNKDLGISNFIASGDPEETAELWKRWAKTFKKKVR
jgi:hypothetical protein